MVVGSAKNSITGEEEEKLILRQLVVFATLFFAFFCV